MATIVSLPSLVKPLCNHSQPQPHPQILKSSRSVRVTSRSSSERPRHILTRAAISSSSFPPARGPDSITDLPIPAEASIGGGGLDGNGNDGNGNGGSGGNGGWQGDSSGGSSNGAKNNSILALLLKGWSDRVEADPQFVFKVLTEQIIGVSACVIGDMATRPNFGLNELDFVFCTLVVGSIVNFALMYLLAPTTAVGITAKALPSIFSGCPPAHMFEGGSYSLLSRAGTFVYKGTQFAAVGFLAGLAGTAISTLLLEVRKSLQPDFILQNKPPPPLLNAATWAIHMGLSSNFRYQCLNGLDQVLLPVLNPALFLPLAFIVRGTNNIIGGSTFVMLAKVTGSQKALESPVEEVKGGEAVKGEVVETVPAV